MPGRLNYKLVDLQLFSKLHVQYVVNKFDSGVRFNVKRKTNLKFGHPLFIIGPRLLALYIAYTYLLQRFIPGIWAVVCTNGITYRGPLAQQEIGHWDTILKTNIVGVLRTARTFQNLLKNSSGRIITIGTTNNMGGGLVAYAASRYVQQKNPLLFTDDIVQITKMYHP